MNRERFDELLDVWAEGRLTADQAREFESLLVAHPVLRAEADTHRAFLSMVRSSPLPQTPPELLERALRRAREEQRRERALTSARVVPVPPRTIDRRQMRAARLRWMYSAAAAIALMVGGGYLVLQSLDEAPVREQRIPLVHDPSGHALEGASLGRDAGSMELATNGSARELADDTSIVADEVRRGVVVESPNYGTYFFEDRTDTRRVERYAAPTEAPAAPVVAMDQEGDRARAYDPRLAAPVGAPTASVAELDKLADAPAQQQQLAMTFGESSKFVERVAAEPPLPPPRMTTELYRYLAAQATASGGRVAGGEAVAEARTAFYVEFPDRAALDAFNWRLQHVPVPVQPAVAEQPPRTPADDIARRERSVASEPSRTTAGTTLVPDSDVARTAFAVGAAPAIEQAEAMRKQQDARLESASDFYARGGLQITEYQYRPFRFDAFTSQVLSDMNSSRVRLILRPEAEKAAKTEAGFFVAPNPE